MDPHIPHVIIFRRVIPHRNGNALRFQVLIDLGSRIVEIAMACSCSGGGKHPRKYSCFR